MIDGSEKRYGLMLVNNGTFRKMSIIEIKTFINSHCANIDPKIFFHMRITYISGTNSGLYKKRCEITTILARSNTQA